MNGFKESSRQNAAIKAKKERHWKFSANAADPANKEAARKKAKTKQVAKTKKRST
jgi:hypothetical protein